MTTSPLCPPRRVPGQGTQRERRPGVWEIRIPLGPDPSTGRTRHRSVTVHGDVHHADFVRRQLISNGVPAKPPAPMVVAELLRCWLSADQPWRPSTLIGYRSVARALATDPLGRQLASNLTPDLVRTSVTRWQHQGHSTAVIGGRFRVLRSALGWAYTERLLDVEPLRHMRGPGRCAPRLPLSDDYVRTLLSTAELQHLEAIANDTDAHRGRARRHHAGQNLLLVRLAADTGARRGELAALRIEDLRGTILTIDRAVSGGQLTSPKSGRSRSLTVGGTTAALWHGLVHEWTACLAADSDADRDQFGPWLFGSDLAHRHRLGAEALGHRFAHLRDDAGVPAATLHRLRHSVATLLVSRGQVLQAQARLGHADAATTLREYAYALPLTDQSVADQMERHLAQPAPDRDGQRHSRP